MIRAKRIHKGEDYMQLKFTVHIALVLVTVFVTTAWMPPDSSQVSTAPRLPADVYPVSVVGNRGPGNELCVAGNTPGCLTIPVQGGDQVTIGAASGNVIFDIQDNSINCTYSANPNGIARTIIEDATNILLCYPNEANPPDPLLSASHASLLMKRDSLYTFVGASGTAYSASNDHSLFLGVNDGIPGNNSGVFNLSVTIVRRPRLYLPLAIR